MKLAGAVATALLFCTSMPAAAQSVKVAFNGNRVDVVAENATVRAILNEWARVGGTRIINAERLTGGPVTVEFRNAYERQVLESLLRGASGYLLGPRPVGAPGGPSGFDRIMILPTSTAPRAATVVAQPQLQPRTVAPQPLRRLVPNDGAAPTEEVEGPVVIGAPPQRLDSQADVQRRLGDLLADSDDDEPQQGERPAPTPVTPFGGQGVSRPGVIPPAPPAGRPDPASGAIPAQP